MSFGAGFSPHPFPVPILDEPESLIHRTLVGASVVGAAGAVVLLLLGRTGWAIGFALGATVSLGNFHLITRAVARLSGPNPAGASRHLWKGALFRFGIVGIVLFVAVVVFRLNVLALLAGLLLTQLAMLGYWIVRSVQTNPNDQ